MILRTRFVRVAMLVPLVAACEGREGGAPAESAGAAAVASPGAPSRIVADAGPERWRVTDTSFAEPAAMVAGDGIIVVADAGAARVVALDAATGARRWTVGTADGIPLPGGLLAPIALASAPERAVAILDAGARRIHVVGAEGRVRRTVAVPDDIEPRRLCARADGGFVASGADPRGRLLLLAPDGAREATLELPWRDVDTLDDLRLQAVLASRGARCVAALMLGRGFAVIEPGPPPRVRATPYVEPMELPALVTAETASLGRRVRVARVADAPMAAVDVAVTDSLVLVAFHGRSADRAHLVDVYAMTDGRYLRSLRLARPPQAIAATDDALYVLQRDAGRWSVVAFALPR